MATEHQWFYEEVEDGTFFVCNDDDRTSRPAAICEDEEMAARIVACVNACALLPTEALMSAGDQPVNKLVDAVMSTNQYLRELHAGGGPLFDAARAIWEMPGD